jgi:hypothetical protein
MRALALNQKAYLTIRNNRNAANSFFEVVFFEKALRMQGYIVRNTCSLLKCIRLAHIVVPSFTHWLTVEQRKMRKDG